MGGNRGQVGGVDVAVEIGVADEGGREEDRVGIDVLPIPPKSVFSQNGIVVEPDGQMCGIGGDDRTGNASASPRAAGVAAVESRLRQSEFGGLVAGKNTLQDHFVAGDVEGTEEFAGGIGGKDKSIVFCGQIRWRQQGQGRRR